MRARALCCALAMIGCASPHAGTAFDGVEPAADEAPPVSVITIDPPPPGAHRPRARAPIPLRPDAPPVSGGTLLATRRGLLVAGDELTDTIFVVDPDRPAVVGEVQLAPGSMPGRMAEDDVGMVHIVLRGAGRLLRLDPSAPTAAAQTPICAAPRGIDFHEAAGLLRVACADGALLGLTPEHELRERWALDPDLRDVVASGDRVFVSRFRSAELLVLDSDGALIRRTAPPEQTFSGVSPPAVMVPRVAWRMRAHGPDGVVMSHQREVSTDISAFAVRADSGAITYYGGGGGFVRDVPRFVLEQRITTFDRDGAVVDTRGTSPGPRSSQLVDLADWEGSVIGAWASDGWVAVTPVALRRFALLRQDTDVLLAIHSRDQEDQLIYRPVPLAGIDPGRTVFHSGSSAGIACASCHPEGGEDGHTWITAETGPRRSQSLLGGLADTAPFHWGGELADFDRLMDVQGQRLLRTFTVEQTGALLSWLDRLPESGPIAPMTPEGLEAFGAAGCADCHDGPHLSDGLSHDVGAGEVQTPRLPGVWARAPFFHDGCAETLEQTLDGTCRDTDAHGVADPASRALLVVHMSAL